MLCVCLCVCVWGGGGGGMLIINEIFRRIDPEITADKYTVSKVFEPGEGRTRDSAKIIFNDFRSRMSILRNCKKMCEINENDATRKSVLDARIYQLLVKKI